MPLPVRDRAEYDVLPIAPCGCIVTVQQAVCGTRVRGVLDEITALDLIKPGASVENRSSETDWSAWRYRHGVARPDMAPVRII